MWQDDLQFSFWEVAGPQPAEYFPLLSSAVQAVSSPSVCLDWRWCCHVEAGSDELCLIKVTRKTKREIMNIIHHIFLFFRDTSYLKFGFLHLTYCHTKIVLSHRCHAITCEGLPNNHNLIIHNWSTMLLFKCPAELTTGLQLQPPEFHCTNGLSLSWIHRVFWYRNTKALISVQMSRWTYKGLTQISDHHNYIHCTKWLLNRLHQVSMYPEHKQILLLLRCLAELTKGWPKPQTTITIYIVQSGLFLN